MSFNYGNLRPAQLNPQATNEVMNDLTRFGTKGHERIKLVKQEDGTYKPVTAPELGLSERFSRGLYLSYEDSEGAINKVLLDFIALDNTAKQFAQNPKLVNKLLKFVASSEQFKKQAEVVRGKFNAIISQSVLQTEKQLESAVKQKSVVEKMREKITPDLFAEVHETLSQVHEKVKQTGKEVAITLVSSADDRLKYRQGKREEALKATNALAQQALKAASIPAQEPGRAEEALKAVQAFDKTEKEKVATEQPDKKMKVFEEKEIKEKEIPANFYGFMCKDGLLLAHKTILNESSSFCRDLSKTVMKKPDAIDLTEFPKAIVNKLLDYLYLQQPPKFKDREEARQLINLAEYLGIEPMEPLRKARENLFDTLFGMNPHSCFDAALEALTNSESDYASHLPFVLGRLQGQIKHKGTFKGVDEPIKQFLRTLLEESEDPCCQVTLAVCELYGFGGDVDFKAAANRLIALKATVEPNDPHPSVLTWLSYCYFQGDGVQKDLPQARQLLEKAVNQNDPGAINRFAVLYEQEGSKGKIEMFERASKLGDIYALHNLGITYIKGKGVEKKFEKGN